MQTTTQEQQKTVINQTPKVITTKDFLYLKDQLSWELLAMKKCRHFAAECSDPEIAAAIDKAGQMHQRHYGLILRHLQNDNNTEMGKFQSQQQGGM